MPKADAPLSWCIAGQCAFTYRVAAAAVARHVPIRAVAVFPDVDADPFPGLAGDHPWLAEHRFHYGGWREHLRELSSIHQFELITGDDLWERAAEKEVLAVAGLAMKVPSGILERFGARALNVHPSLLPDLRGPQPEAQAILRGYRESGVTIHTMTDRYDSGPIRFRERYQVGNATVGELEATAARVAARGLCHLASISPQAWPTLDPDRSSRYCRAYDAAALDLREDLRINDALRRLRLRPEGYAYRDEAAIRLFPVAASSTACPAAHRLEFSDGSLFAHAWIERTGERFSWNQCSCSSTIHAVASSPPWS